MAVRDPRRAELIRLARQERRYLEDYAESRRPALLDRAADKTPEKLKAALNAGFEKSLSTLLTTGVGVTDAVFGGGRAARKAEADSERLAEKPTRRNLRAFSSGARRRAAITAAAAGVKGAGLGLLGVGLPDIPVLVATLIGGLRAAAARCGIDPDGAGEAAFAMTLIEAALSDGYELKRRNAAVDNVIESYGRTGRLLHTDRRAAQKRAAEALAREAAAAKFLQSLPLVGAAGGIRDYGLTKRILRYAELKYRKRMLLGGDGQQA